MSVPAQQIGLGGGELRFIPNSELNARRRAREYAAQQLEAPIPRLSQHLSRLWEEAKQAKEKHNRLLLQDLRQRNGTYDPDTLAQIRIQGGSEIYMMLTSVKCRAAAAWIRDIAMPETERAWSIEPTPEPDLPPSAIAQVYQQVEGEWQRAMQKFGQVDPEHLRQRIEWLRERMVEVRKMMAERAAARMSLRIADQLQDGGWEMAMREFIDDLVTYRAAILRGPVVRNRPMLTWGEQEIVGRRDFMPRTERRPVLEFNRRSPFDIFPSADATGCQDGYLFDHHRLTIGDLNAMMGVPGYSDSAIRTVIDEYGRGGLREWLATETERASLEGRPTEHYHHDSRISALNFWGQVSGDMLIEWGMKQDVDRHRSYQIEAWKIGRHVVKATLNPHPLGERPYSKTSFEKVPGAFWGRGIPALMRDDQQMCNAAARAIANNMGIASGPQVVINDISRLAAGEDVTQLYPWKIWQFGADKFATGANRPALDFFQPNPLVDMLLKVYEHFSKTADEHTNMPSYAYGDTDRIGGAGRTASGLSMLMGQVTKGLKLVTKNLDLDVHQPTITRVYVHNMLFDKDESIKGDLRVKARGSSSLLVKEQRQLRLNEFTQMTANPVDAAIMGMAGRATLLRETARDMIDIPIDKVIPDPETLQGMPIPGTEPQGAEQQPEAPTPEDQRKLEAEDRKYELESAKLEEDKRRADREHELRVAELEIKRGESQAKARIEGDRAKNDRDKLEIERDHKRIEAEEKRKEREEGKATEESKVKQLLTDSETRMMERHEALVTDVRELLQRTDEERQSERAERDTRDTGLEQRVAAIEESLNRTDDFRRSVLEQLAKSNSQFSDFADSKLKELKRST